MKPHAWNVPKLWPGERVFILAGGSSIDFRAVSKIRGRTIAIKHSVLLVPMAEILFWADSDFHRRRPVMVCTHRGALLVKRNVDSGIPEWIKQVKRAAPETPLSINPENVAGLCSGGSAINLAYLLGAAEIVLVGFDFDGRHWFPGHEAPVATDVQHDRHRAAVEAMADPLWASGVKVFNCSDCSTLTKFEKRRLEEFV